MQSRPLLFLSIMVFGLTVSSAFANPTPTPPPAAAESSDAAAPAPDAAKNAPAPATASPETKDAPAQPAAADATSPSDPAAAPLSRPALRARVRAEALKAGLPGEIADAVAEVESAYDPDAIGGVGEVGLMQVLPTTARMLGFKGTNAELAEPDINIRYGVTYLSEAWRLADKDICTTVMKYRAGHGETRFSHRSVNYCLRVRSILAAQGYNVTGEVPKATFGDALAAGPVAAGGPRRVAGRRVKSRMNWAAADARMNAIVSKITAASLSIAR